MQSLFGEPDEETDVVIGAKYRRRNYFETLHICNFCYYTHTEMWYMPLY